MNQDFILNMTPALARRLLLLQSKANIELPEHLHDLAQQERLNESHFDPIVCRYNDERATIMQFLLDCGMRGIVQAIFHPCMDEATMLKTAQLSGIKKISILTRHQTKWKRHVNSFFLTDIATILPLYGRTGQWIDAQRDGLLLIDLCEDMGSHVLSCARFVREFPQTIIYQSNTVASIDLIHWSILAELLYPTIPVPTKAEFVLFYNMCLFPQFMTASRLSIVHDLDQSNPLRSLFR